MDAVYGEISYRQKLKNGAIVGYCMECGGEVKRVYGSRVRKGELVCTRCGMVNSRLRRVELNDDEVVRAMRAAYEEISRRVGENELVGNAWLRAVEYLLGQSIPIGLWKRKGAEWIEQAGLIVEDGMVRRREM